MSIPINSVSLKNTEPLMLLKNEPPESEIGLNGSIDSSKEDIIPDIKDIIDVVWHPLCEDSIKSETVQEKLLKTEHSESVETQVLVRTENTPFVKIENITDSENLNKTQDISNDNGQEVVEVQDSNKHFNTLNNLETNKILVLKFSKKTDFAECYETIETTSWEKDKEKMNVIEAPVILVEPHEYTSLAKDKHVCNHCQRECNLLENVKRHIKRMHRKVTTLYQCPYCPHKSKWSVREHIIQKHKDTKDIRWFQCHLCEKKFKLKYNLTKHMKVHLTHEQMQDRLKLCPVCGRGFKERTSLRQHIRFVHNKEKRNKEKRKCQEGECTTTKSQLLKHHIKNTHKKRYLCDKCDYKTMRRDHLHSHKLNHLKPEEIQYFQCYHCSYKSKYKQNLKNHIFKHFKNGNVPFHCYICNYMMLKREAIVEHIKKHSKVQIKSEIDEGSSF